MDFTKLGMCIDIVELCLGIANGQISSIFDKVICPQYIRILLQDNNSSNSQWILAKFDRCIYIVEICFGIAHWQISSIFDRVICRQHDNGGVLTFHILFILMYSDCLLKHQGRVNILWCNSLTPPPLKKSKGTSFDENEIFSGLHDKRNHL